MASLASIIKRSLAPAARGAIRSGPVSVEDLYRLRPLPNEDIFLYSKRIDNSHIVRQPNPREGGACWSTIAAAFVVAALFISALLPGLANILSGYKLQNLKAEEASLSNDLRQLNVEEASLLSRGHLEDLAQANQYTMPKNGQVVHLDSKDGKMALSRR